MTQEMIIAAAEGPIYLELLIGLSGLVGTVLSGVVVKLYKDKQKLHSYNAERDKEDLIILTGLKGILKQVKIETANIPKDLVKEIQASEGRIIKRMEDLL